MLLGPQLVEEGRARRQRGMDRRERTVEGTAALLFLAAAMGLALALHSSREWDPVLALGLVVGYASVSRIRFECSDVFVSAEQVVFFPMLVLMPIETVPLLVCAARLLAVVPDVVAGSWHRERLLTAISESWFSVGPVLVIAALAAGSPTLDQWAIYALAFAAEVAVDLGGARLREWLQGESSLSEFFESSLGTLQVDVILTPIAFVLALTALEAPLALLSIAPLIWLLRVFSKDRRERYTATLELNRAYRGTVMLLGDVVESDDGYTGNHSRSVVELVQGVTEEMGINGSTRQEMEFAALLHDVGKISIPKEILNKPAKLTDEEFELMKTHTVEGQFLLDRVGGLLGRIGEIVRSCHERWDGQGYPDGLKGEAIPLAARIVFACDAYNAMTTDRPYRPAMARQSALEELSTHSGTQFDPTVVTALTHVVKESQPESRAVDEVRVLMSEVRLQDRVRAVT
jgi:HD-GYP domain-containing protein (c-di-GMP phosphodiesterase class II)